MFDNLMNFLKKFNKREDKIVINSKEAAKERLHLVLMQDRANVSADFLELMKQEIIEVIKKYIDVDENAIDVRLTNKENADGTNGAPALYANIPILNIKNENKKSENKQEKNEEKIKKEETTEKEEVNKEEMDSIKEEQEEKNVNDENENKDVEEKYEEKKQAKEEIKQEKNKKQEIKTK